MIDPATERYYQDNAEVWAAHLPHRFSSELDPFLDRLAPGSAILELGCGDGRDAQRMEQRGFTVDATDGVESMVALAGKRLSRPARTMRFDELDAVDRYDAVWCHTSLHHAPFAELPGVLVRVCRALRPGGWHFANYKLGQGDDRDSLGRLYNFPPRADLLAAYAAVPGWRVIALADTRRSGMDKVERDWLSITMRKDG